MIDDKNTNHDRGVVLAGLIGSFDSFDSGSLGVIADIHLQHL